MKRARASGSSPRRSAAAAPKKSACGEVGSSASARSMSWPAWPVSCESSLQREGLGLTHQGIGAAAPGHAIGALIGTHRQWILLQRHVGAT